MDKMLLAAAASLAAIAAPAAAQSWSANQFTAGPSARSNHWSSRSSGDRMVANGRDGDRHHHDRRHHRDGDFVGAWGWGDGDWAYANNRTFNSDSYNDWWHDRPDRAFPRWMQNNQNCDRLWWSGGGWRC